MLNIQGMNPGNRSKSNWKFDYLQSILNDNFTPSVIALTETHLKSYVENAQITIPNYNLLRSDRKLRVGGGVLLYTHNDLPFTHSKVFDNGTCEAVMCASETLKSICICAYRPPNSSHRDFEEMMLFIESFTQDRPDFEINLLGDFNFPGISWPESKLSNPNPPDNSVSANLLKSFMGRFFLSQYINIPTRQKNILDLFLTNSPHIVQHISSKPTKLSDHNLVEIPITLNSTLSFTPVLNTPKPPVGFRALNLHKAKYEKINEDLANVNWDNLRTSCTPEEYPEILNQTVLDICKKHSPEKLENPSKASKAKSTKGKNLHSLNRKKRKRKARLSALINLNPSSPSIPKLKREIGNICLAIKDTVKQLKIEEELNLVSKIKSNPKAFYSYTKRNSKTKSSINHLIDKSGKVVTDHQGIANLFQDYFKSVFSDPDSPAIDHDVGTNPPISSPLANLTITTKEIEDMIDCIQTDSSCPDNDLPASVLKNCKTHLSYPIKLIWEESFHIGIVPKFYKTQFIHPIHKKDSNSFASNYRPISITSHVIKVFERILRNHLVKYLEENNLINVKQHGFRKGRSCLTQLLAYYDEILTNALSGNDTDAIYIDFAKAFDKIDHNILLKKLTNYGISGKFHSWIKSFLTERDQAVTINGTSSYLTKVISGVPQGTVLGPLLFLIYINELSSQIKSSTCSSFADDTRLAMAISCQDDMQCLSDDLNIVHTWSLKNNMSLNQNKYELISFQCHPNNTLKELPFHTNTTTYTTPGGILLHPQQVVKDLGILVSNDMTWNSHILSIAAKATKKAAWVLNTFYSRSELMMITIYKSLVRSHLEYCCPLWNPQDNKNIQILENIQKNFLRKIPSLNHLSYWEKLKKLRLQSLQRRRERYCIVHMWKIINNLAPNDLDFDIFMSPRLGIKVRPKPMMLPMSRHQTNRDRSFVHVGPLLWNLLPKEASTQTDLNSFKTSLGAFLDKYPDNPPISDLRYINNNSLLSYPRFL